MTPKTKTSRWVVAIIFLPALLHVAAFGSSIFRSGAIPFGLTDFILILALVVYLGAALVAIRERRFALRFVLVTYSILLMVTAAESFLRFLAPACPENYPHYPVKRVSHASDTMPGISGEISWSVNRLGLRGPEVDIRRVRHRILAVGGSTTECLYVTDTKTWAWRLQDRLSESLGEPVYVGNAGRGGHFTLNHEYLLRHYPFTDYFEWVIVLAGINDLGRLLRNDYLKRSYRVPEETLLGTAKLPYYRSSVLYRLVSARLRGDVVVQDAEGRWIAEKREIRRKALSHGPVSDPPGALEEALAVYKQNLRKIIASCRSRHQKVLMLTQPTLYRKNMPDHLRTLLWAHVNEKTVYTEEVLAFLVDAYNRAMIEVCRDEGVDCIDLASLLPKDTSVLYDDCHFNVSGCDKVAGILHDFLLTRLSTGKGAVAASGKAGTTRKSDSLEPDWDFIRTSDGKMLAGGLMASVFHGCSPSPEGEAGPSMALGATSQAIITCTLI